MNLDIFVLCVNKAAHCHLHLKRGPVAIVCERLTRIERHQM